MDIGKVLEPDEYKAFKKRVSSYNKEYYRKNKDRIMEKRLERSLRKSK